MSERIWVGHHFNTIEYSLKHLRQHLPNAFILRSTELRDEIDEVTPDFGINSSPDFGIKLHFPAEACVWNAMIYEDPEMSDSEYIEWVKRVIRTCGIEAFVPNYKRAVFRNKDVITDVESTGCCVISNADVSGLTSSKSHMYNVNNALKSGDRFSAYTPYFKVSTWQEFRAAYDELRKFTEVVTIKPDSGLGGTQFMKIVDQLAQVEDVVGNKRTVSYAMMLEAFSHGTTKDWIMMPYLQNELSIDCLPIVEHSPLSYQTFYQLGIIARHKIRSHKEELVPITPKIDMYLRNLQAKAKFQWPFNVQFRQHEDDWVCIDINPRISGGAPRLAEYLDMLTMSICTALGREYPKVRSMKLPSIITTSETCFIRPCTHNNSAEPTTEPNKEV